MSADRAEDLRVVQRVLLSRLQHAASKPYLRLLHGRGGDIAAVREWHIDQLGDVLLVVAHRQQTWEAQWLDELTAWARAQGLTGLWIQRRYVALAPISVVWGDATRLNEPMLITEEGLTYELRFANQNIGLFPDMLRGRCWVREHAENARILNLFAYTCGFSVAAVAGGAQGVINMDMSKASLAWGRRNHELNHHDKTRVQYLGHNVMKSFGRIERLAPFDLIIIDPPSFQRGHFEAPRDYKRLLRRLPGWLTPEGEGRVMCCLNDPLLSEQQFMADILQPAGLSAIEVLPTRAGSVSADQTQALKIVIAALN